MKTTREEIINTIKEESGLKWTKIAANMGIKDCTLSNLKRRGFNDYNLKKYAEACGFKFKSEISITIGDKEYKLK